MAAADPELARLCVEILEQLQIPHALRTMPRLGDRVNNYGAGFQRMYQLVAELEEQHLEEPQP